jgi:hypothetical protein
MGLNDVSVSPTDVIAARAACQAVCTQAGLSAQLLGLKVVAARALQAPDAFAELQIIVTDDADTVLCHALVSDVRGKMPVLVSHLIKISVYRESDDPVLEAMTGLNAAFAALEETTK